MKRQTHFYNTVSIGGTDLQEAIAKAKTQSDAIYEVFKSNPDRSYTPIDIYDMFKDSILLTSVRRSLSNMTDAGLLVKTELKSYGRYGVVNHKWKLKK